MTSISIFDFEKSIIVYEAVVNMPSRRPNEVKLNRISEDDRDWIGSVMSSLKFAFGTTALETKGKIYPSTTPSN